MKVSNFTIETICTVLFALLCLLLVAYTVISSIYEEVTRFLHTPHGQQTLSSLKIAAIRGAIISGHLLLVALIYKTWMAPYFRAREARWRAEYQTSQEEAYNLKQSAYFLEKQKYPDFNKFITCYGWHRKVMNEDYVRVRDQLQEDICQDLDMLEEADLLSTLELLSHKLH